MGFQYNYRPDGGFKGRVKSTLKKDSGTRKKIFAFGVVFLAIFIFYGVNTSVTGFVTYQKTIESELNKTQIALAGAQTERDECNTNLFNTIKESDACNEKLKNTDMSLVNCEGKRDELQKYSDELNVFYTQCQSDKSGFETKYNDVVKEMEKNEEDFNRLVRNVVQGICCSFNDVQTGVVKNWDITTDKHIVCIIDGAFTINCGNGETNF